MFFEFFSFDFDNFELSEIFDSLDIDLSVRFTILDFN